MENKTEEFYLDKISSLVSEVDNLAKHYYTLLAENVKLHFELQELQGNIRVYCRIRPSEKGKQTIIEHAGENGELIVANSTKPTGRGRRSFRFDKVYGPTSTQDQVFADTQPLIQSVLDGYNVCIFAYGQSGSGKTYTMTGPDGASEEEMGITYRALNDLFKITQSRASIFQYEVSVQMVEIYNEQVRDLLSTHHGRRKKKKIHNILLDACIHPVKSIPDMVELMDIGLKNRARSSTSSNSHIIVSIHTKATDLKSGCSIRAGLHLVDLAGSERAEHSEARHVNKSLSAFQEVVFALSVKSPHVPYHKSKLTQLLQASFGGRAKALMFVQLNPDAYSYNETLSNLTFAERVSTVKLGASKNKKDYGEIVCDLMLQVASLKETIAKKDEEMEALKNPKNGAAAEKGSTSSLR